MSELLLPSIFFKNAAGWAAADPAGFLRVQWGPQARTLADTCALFAQIAQGLQRHNWSRALINQIGMAPFTPEEQQWVAHSWLPKAVADSGYRHGAIIVSPDVFVRLVTTFVTARVQDLAITYRTFNFETEAVRWLLEQPLGPQ